MTALVEAVRARLSHRPYHPREVGQEAAARGSGSSRIANSVALYLR